MFKSISLAPGLTGISINQGDYDQIVGVDPQDANKVYIGLRRLWFSGDGGQSGIGSSNEIDPNPSHADVHAIAFSAARTNGSPTRVYIGSDGGFSSTAAQGSAPGSQWQYLNNGLATFLFYGMDIGRGSIANNATVYAASQDNGMVERAPSASGANHWSSPCCGDAFSVAVDPTNPAYAFGINGPSPGPFVSLGWPGPTFSGTLSVIGFDPNGGAAYASVGPQLFLGKANQSAPLLMHTFPQNVTAMNQVEGTMWVGLNDGTVQYTHTAREGAASTWTKVTISGSPGQAVSGIAIDPTNVNTVVVVYPGFTGSTPPAHAFLLTKNARSARIGIEHYDAININGTNNGGFSDLPDLPLHAVVIVPYTSPHTIVVGSDMAVMQSADLGQTWQVLGTGFPTVQVTALAFDPAVNPPVLRASTLGRSIFELPFYPDPPKCLAVTRCTGWVTITCTGEDVGIRGGATGGECADADQNGDPQNPQASCSVGFTGSSTASLLALGGFYGTACAVHGSEKKCVVVTAADNGVDTTNGGSGLCGGCGEGYRWCTKFGPPRCAPDQDCTLTSPRQPPQ